MEELVFTEQEIKELKGLRKRMPLNYAGRPLKEWVIAMVGFGFDGMAEDEQVYDDEEE